jgi:hypothetical protein
MGPVEGEAAHAVGRHRALSGLHLGTGWNAGYAGLLERDGATSHGNGECDAEPDKDGSSQHVQPDEASLLRVRRGSDHDPCRFARVIGNRLHAAGGR